MVSNTEMQNAADHSETGYEKKDVNLRQIILGAVVIIGVIVVILVLLTRYFVIVKEAQVYDAVLKPESAALRELRAREAEVLNSYKLLDSANGVYQIPISRAMELTADEAFQSREGK